MAQSTSIEWTDVTWNPVTGCTKVSPGCKHCYAERMALRLQAMNQRRYREGFRLTLQPDLLEQPLRWRQPRTVFVNSMSDLFHDDVPLEYLRLVFNVMAKASWHVFQILTKRAERLEQTARELPWPPNVWIGVSVESEDYLFRIKHLRRVPGAVRFLSVEPLLSRIRRLPLRSIDWVIVGGESGPGARPIQPDWVRTIRDSCLTKDVPFFFKQWGGVHKSRYGRLLDGQTWDQMPSLRAPGSLRPTEEHVTGDQGRPRTSTRNG
jgi:protein gp37